MMFRWLSREANATRGILAEGVEEGLNREGPGAEVVKLSMAALLVQEALRTPASNWLL